MEIKNKTLLWISVALALLVITLIGIMIVLMLRIQDKPNDDSYNRGLVNSSIDFSNEDSGLSENTKNVINVPANKKVIFNNFFKIKSRKQNNSVTNVVDDEVFVGPEQEYNQPSNTVYNFTDFNNQEQYLFIALNLYDLQSVEKNKKWEYFNVLDNVKNVLAGKLKLDNFNFQSANDLIFPFMPVICSTPTHNKFIKTDFLSGFRFTTNCVQEYAPVKTATYFFNGLSNDGKYHITFKYSDLKIKSIEQYFSENPDEELSNEVSVIEKTIGLFENEEDNNFTPSLLEIDKFIESIQYK